MKNISIIQRHVQERTAVHSAKLLSNLFQDDVSQITANPFSNNLLNSINLAIARDNEYTLIIDGDVIPSRDILRWTNSIVKSQNPFFVVEPYVLDKFSNSVRRAGVHLYKTKSLVKMKGEYESFTYEEKNDFLRANRPETFLKSRLKLTGERKGLSGSIVGIHDFLQYHSDIYRTNYLYARKYTKMVNETIDLWRELLGHDLDYKSAILGFSSGLRNFDLNHPGFGLILEKWHEDAKLFSIIEKNSRDNLTDEVLELQKNDTLRAVLTKHVTLHPVFSERHLTRTFSKAAIRLRARKLGVHY